MGEATEPSAFAFWEQEEEQVWEHAAQGEERESWEEEQYPAEEVLAQRFFLPQQLFVVSEVWGFCVGEQIPLPHCFDGGNGLAHHVAAM